MTGISFYCFLWRLISVRRVRASNGRQNRFLYRSHRNEQSRKNIVFMRLCGVSGILFSRRGEQIILLFFIIPYFYTNVKGKIFKLNDAIFLSVSYCLYFFCLIFKSYSCYDTSRFLGYKEDRATSSPLLGLLICSKITQQKGENAIKREKIAVCKEVYRPLCLCIIDEIAAPCNWAKSAVIK